MNKKQKEALQSCLDIESRTLKGLKQTYKQALRDCNQKIRELSSRTDMENLQSVIYQKQYQEALKGQLEGVMANLQSGAYAKISDYLAQCYQNGFVGTMYDLAGQGIPLIIPVDKNAIAKAIQLKSKLSKSLYDRLGEDVGALKKSVSSELSRGIAAGLTWNEVAGNMSRSFKHTPFNRAYNNSVRIARTEGHRVQVQSTMDAQRKAKSKGADMVKQWDATLDSATRDAHRELDGKIAEIDDDFKWSGGSVSAPGMFGDPAQDCNCRCALLSRARWALDDDELKTLQDRATYFGIDKSEDFEDYKNKYLGISDEDVEKYCDKTLEKSSDNNIIKLGINLFDKNDPLYLDMFSIEEEPGFEDIGLHGSPESVQKIIDGKPRNFTAKEFADYLQKNGYHGGDIRLASCSTGKGDNSFAQQLSKELGVRVKAPDDDVYFAPNEGIMFVGSPNMNIGHWRIFNNGVEE